MDLEHLISTYGYLTLVVGTFLEGETILVLGGVAAKLGYLHLPWVIGSAFIGSLSGDQLLFFLGRYRGEWVLNKLPAWRRRAEKAHRVVERHRIPIILGFRFVYGFRTVTPLVLGMSRVPALEFVVLNVISAAAWAAAIASIGYAFGEGVELVFGNLRHYEMALLGAVALGGAALWLIHRAAERRRQRREERGG